MKGSTRLVTVTFANGTVTDITITNPGSGYSSTPTIAVPGYDVNATATVSYTAELSTLPVDALEAAVLDGAGMFRILRSVLHPMLRGTHITVVLALLLGSFRAFEIVFLGDWSATASASASEGRQPSESPR